MPLREYPRGRTFPGQIGRTFDVSEPAWPEPVRAREGAPNVVFVVLDDTGYGQLGCYGSPIRTPNIDRLAAGGLQYSNLQTTALCSPSRSCILTGRNHHANAMAAITETSTGFPGYNGNIPFENGFLSEILRQEGYNTYAVGKWHLTPSEQLSAAGPYDRWPLGRGFDRYYGFLGGDTHQYYPELVADNQQVEPPATPDEGYHLTEDLVDRAIAFVGDAKQVAPDKPFFLYFCTGAMHAPHHVPREWADRYRGRFDEGWDAYREEVFAEQKRRGLLPEHARLSERDPDVAAWDDLTDDERRLYARMMEVFAGFLEHTDHHIGRLVDFLERIGELDDTLVVVVSDNGASAEGGPHGSVNENQFFNFVPEALEDNLAAIDELGGPEHFNHYPWGWTWAGNTPFRRWKRETYRGGTSDPLIVHWPAGIDRPGTMRHQYAHVVDLVPTVLDALGIEPPDEIRGVTQSPIQGVSFAHTFDDPDAPTRHHTQYFEMIGHRALYHDGWKAVCPWPGPHFAGGRPFGEPLTDEGLRTLDATGWELYDLRRDPTETTDLAAEHRDRLVELISLWYAEAGRYDVLPIDGRAMQRFAEERPQITPDRDVHVYWPGTQPVPANSAARLVNRSFTITADVEVPEDGAEGVLFAQGGIEGGHALFLRGGRLHYVYNYVARAMTHLESAEPVPSGRVQLRYEFERTGEASMREGLGAPGVGRLFVDGRQVGEAKLEHTVPVMFGISASVTVGRATGSPVCGMYAGAFPFTGGLDAVRVEVGREHVTSEQDHEAQMRIAMARQ
jgi:arylsulfatase A-like enzyme